MALTIDVPANTMLADLDESLRALLLRELGRHGYDGVGAAFEAPTREWSAALSAPTVALFLYDVREAEDERRTDWREQRENGRAWRERPPLMVDCSYSVTAWTRAVEDEHRLLSQVLAILYAHRDIPSELLAGRLADPVAQPVAVRGRVGEGREASKADFWTALGGQYKASVEYVVTLACPAGTVAQRGPEARTQVVRTQLADAPRSVDASHRAGGTVRDASGEPVAGAWVVLHEVGGWATSDPEGRFTFDRVPAGRHRCSVRAPDGAEQLGELVVPGPGVDLVVDAKR